MAPKPTPQTDAVGVVAHLVYVLVGGMLVFGFAWALIPAVESQNQSACRPLRPEPRDLEAPAFEGQDLDGNPVRLTDLRGKFVVVNFWATWCEPCVTEWPQIAQLAERFADRDDIAILAISIDKKREDIGPFLERMKLADSNVQVLWDPSTKAHETFGSKKIPDTFFVDESGRVVQAYVNVRKWGSPGASQCVDSMAGRAS